MGLLLEKRMRIVGGRHIVAFAVGAVVGRIGRFACSKGSSPRSAWHPSPTAAVTKIPDDEIGPACAE